MLLLVEDDPTDRLIVREYLSENQEVSFLLNEAQNMRECLEFLKDKKYEAILLDLGLPDSQGEETLKKVIDAAPNTPVLVLTGLEDERVGVRAMRLGAQEYLVKGDFQGTLLFTAVRYAIERHRIANELKETLHRLNESDVRIRELININQDAMIVVDEKNIIQFANPAGSKILAQGTKADIGTEFPYDWYGIPDGELKWLDQTGEAHYVEVNSAATHWNGGPAHLLTLHDITERKQSEQDLELFRYLMDHAEESFEVLDAATGQIIDCNETCCRRLGYSRAEMLQLHVWDFDKNLSPELWDGRVQEIINGDLVRFQSAHHKKDGGLFPVEVAIAQVMVSEKTYMVAVVQDISERLRIKTQLQRDADMLSLIDDAILMLDFEWRITYWSDGAKRLLGYSRDERLGTSFLSHFPSNKHNEMLTILNKAIKGELQQVEKKLPNKSGEDIWVEIDLQLTKDDEGEPLSLLVVMRNIEKRRNLENQLRQSQKMDAIGTLAGGIAHDFNNIIAAIRGYTELALRRCTDEQISRDLETVIRASTRATALTEKILTFSKKHPETRVPIYLHKALIESLHLLRATFPATISIESEIDESAPSVLANYEQILQIVLNLGNNSLHAIPNQVGTLFFRLDCRKIDSLKSYSHPHLQSGDYVCISVIDSGVGMRPETIERIFEPFFTTKNLSEGTGLGLAMVHGIMESHDGAITVESELGKGTTFTLYFPVHGMNVNESEDHWSGESKGRGERILLVDDEELLATLGKEALEAFGYQVTICCDPMHALALVRESHERYDLIVTDQTMPSMTGLELAKKAREQCPDQRIIISTGYSASLTLEIAQKAGVYDILHKPVSIEKLSKAVREALDA